MSALHIADTGFLIALGAAAGEGAETVLASEGYGDAVTFVNGFRFIDDLLNRNRQ